MKKKISLLTLTAFCIGDTIGCGIFATLPEGVSRIGSGVIYAWLAAIFLTVLVSIPSLIPSTVLPCPSSSYTLPSRLIHPYVGYLEIVSIINYVTILAFLGTFFGTYLEMVFPDFFNKKCRFGTKPVCITIPVVVAIVIICLNIPLFSLMAVNSVLCIIASVLRLLPVLALIKKYPHTYTRAAVKIPPVICYAWVFLATAVCILVSISTILSTSGTIWWATLAVLGSLYLYFLLRIKFLNKKGYNLLKKMSEPYPEWEENEKNIVRRMAR